MYVKPFAAGTIVGPVGITEDFEDIDFELEILLAVEDVDVYAEPELLLTIIDVKSDDVEELLPVLLARLNKEDDRCASCASSVKVQFPDIHGEARSLSRILYFNHLNSHL